MKNTSNNLYEFRFKNICLLFTLMEIQKRFMKKLPQKLKKMSKTLIFVKCEEIKTYLLTLCVDLSKEH